jgi:hypothetical protein
MDWSSILEKAVAVANVVTALIAIIAIYFAFDAARVARRSVKDSSENFKRQNTPYLQIGGFKVVDNKLIFFLSNLNQYPAKIEGGKFGFSTVGTIAKLDSITKIIRVTDLDKTPEEWQELYNSPAKETKPTFDNTIINYYVVKDSPVEITYGTYAQTFFDMSAAGAKGYFIGRIFYTDEVAGTKRMYEFVVRIYGTPSEVKSEFASNINAEVKTVAPSKKAGR